MGVLSILRKNWRPLMLRLSTPSIPLSSREWAYREAERQKSILETHKAICHDWGLMVDRKLEWPHNSQYTPYDPDIARNKSILQRWWPELHRWWIERRCGYSLADVASVRAKMDEAQQNHGAMLLTEREVRALREAKNGRR